MIRCCPASCHSCRSTSRLLLLSGTCGTGAGRWGCPASLSSIRAGRVVWLCMAQPPVIGEFKSACYASAAAEVARTHWLDAHSQPAPASPHTPVCATFAIEASPEDLGMLQATATNCLIVQQMAEFNILFAMLAGRCHCLRRPGQVRVRG